MRIARIVQQSCFQTHPFNLFILLDIGTNQIQISCIARIENNTTTSLKLDAECRM